MTTSQHIIIIALASLATVLTRFLPFIIFRDADTAPAYIKYLGNVLPGAIFGLLVVYCLKNVSVFSGSHGIPELLAILLIVVIHLWKRNMLLSIATGTVFYMVLVQLVF